MSTFEPFFTALGLTEWCKGEAGQANNLTSLADLAATVKGKDEAIISIWELPFPSMDALHASCPAFPKSSELSKGVENVFLDIKDNLSLVLDPLTQPLSWLLQGALWLFETTPCG